MSRHCSKRNHLFLNWLKTNRSLFLFKPQIDKINGRHIWGSFVGVTSAVHFFFCKSMLEVRVYWKGNFYDRISEFDIAERRCDKGYYNVFVLPEWTVYYPTREALWVQEAFEPFLDWCNKTLATNRYVAIYCYGGGCTEAKLQKDVVSVPNPALQHFLLSLKPVGASMTSEEERDVSQEIIQIIPLFK